MTADSLDPIHPLTPEEPAAEFDRYAWVILFVVFLISVAAPLNMSKVPPLMPVLRETFGLSLSQGGLLMSIFSIAGLILALPTGLIMQRVGPKLTGLVATACLVVGAALGALSPGAGLLMVSRVIEGIGMGLITVVAPAIIAMWFPPAKQGIPMGIWATWVPVGTLLMYNIAPALAAASGWQAVWWAGAGFALVALILFVLLMRLPSVAPDAAQHEGPPAKMGEALANRNIWLLAASFMFFNLAFLGINTYYPTFLAEVRGYGLGQAAFTASIMTMVILVSSPLGGWLSDLIGSRRWLIIVPALILVVMLLLPFRVGNGLIPLLMIAMGAVVGMIPAATFAAVPEVMPHPALAGYGMAAISAGQNLGMVVGPVLFGALVPQVGWVVAGYWMIPACALIAVLAWLVDVR